MEYYTAEKKKELYAVCDSIDGTGKYVKWSKPGGERQIPYDVTYKQNLMNK